MRRPASDTGTRAEYLWPDLGGRHALVPSRGDGRVLPTRSIRRIRSRHHPRSVVRGAAPEWVRTRLGWRLLVAFVLWGRHDLSNRPDQRGRARVVSVTWAGPSGLDFAEGTLILADFSLDMIYQLDTDGNVFDSCASPSGSSMGNSVRRWRSLERRARHRHVLQARFQSAQPGDQPDMGDDQGLLPVAPTIASQAEPRIALREQATPPAWLDPADGVLQCIVQAVTGTAT